MYTVQYTANVSLLYQEEDQTSKLMDHNDLYVLDLAPRYFICTVMRLERF